MHDITLRWLRSCCIGGTEQVELCFEKLNITVLQSDKYVFFIVLFARSFNNTRKTSVLYHHCLDNAGLGRWIISMFSKLTGTVITEGQPRPLVLLLPVHNLTDAVGTVPYG
jgi:hypothetical protein